MIRSNARSLLILATGLLIGLAGPLQAATGSNGKAGVAMAQADTGQSPNSATGSGADSQVVPSDQLNDVDRALQENAPAVPPVAVATSDGPSPAAHIVPASDSGDHSVWDKTSLVGKIFVGFGALLTLASAARMFIA